MKEELKDIWEFTEIRELPRFDKVKAHKEFLKKISESSDLEVHSSSPTSSVFTIFKNVTSFRLVSSVAAAILLGFVAFKFISQDDSIILKSDAIALTYNLPDQSKVTVFPHSSISYNKSEFLKSRDVNLDGKALFEVEKSLSPFTVQFNGSEVSVLGTTFLVSPHEVKVLEGKVKLTINNNEKILSDRQQIILDDESLTITEASFESEVYTPEMSYDNEPLSRVLSDIEVKFDIKFLNQSKLDLTSCKITSLDMKKSSLSGILALLENTTGLKMKQLDKSTYLISTVSCK
jgi:hypothetical protein